MRRLHIVAAAAGVLALLALFACGGGGSGGTVEEGGRGSDPTISGPSKVAAGSRTTFTGSVATGTATAWKWTIAGDGAIVGASNKSTVLVLANAGATGGSYKLVLAAKVGGVWLTKAKVKVVVKAGGVSGTARFRVVLNGASGFSSTTLTSSGQLTMTAASAQAITWAVYFDGDTSGLPAQVPVTVTTNFNGGTTSNVWLNIDGQTMTLSFPRAGGGTVGNGGSVLDTGANRPDCWAGIPDNTTTVTFSAAGVETMVINITL